METIISHEERPENQIPHLKPAVAPPTHQSFWLWVLCLTGVDYFSTLAYQPAIAFEAAGRLAPIASVFLVLLTLFGALPVYRYIAGESPHGQGSIPMLQRLLRGWRGKFLVLVLIGFAMTDFIITMTLSAADAAEHLLHNPLWPQIGYGFNSQLVVTITMSLLLGAVFLKGFKEAISIAVLLVMVFLVLNIMVIGAGLVTLISEPHYVTEWWSQVRAGDLAIAEISPSKMSFASILILSLIFFPKLILGLSGFETGVAVIPLIKGKPDDNPQSPAGRIAGAKKLLLTIAVIMSALLLTSSIVVTTLIPAEELLPGGDAANRALAYLAHGEGSIRIAPWCGEVFGTLYDVSTVVILWFAGASALSGLLSLIPSYLPQYGMAPSWAAAMRPLVVVIISICLIVSLWFRADVTAQGAAYATGVMVLILSGCIAVLIDKYRKAKGTFFQKTPWPTVFITLIFIYTTLAIMIEKPDGLMIALVFVVGILLVSMISRILRSDELRVVRFQLADAETQFIWESLKHLEIPVLAPHRPGVRSLDDKEKELRERHHLSEEIPVVFIEAHLGDPSDFFQEPRLSIHPENGRYVIRLDRCTAIAPALASIAMELSKGGQPVEVHFGWSDENPLRTNLNFLLFGEGNIPWIVRDLLCKAEPDEARRPRVIIG